MHRGQFLGPAPEPGSPALETDRVYGGIKQHQRVGLRTHGGVFACFQALDDAGARRHVTARGTAPGHDALRVDAQLRRMRPHIAYRGFAVLDTLERRCAMPGMHAVLGRKRDQAQFRIMGALRVKLLGRSAGPAAAKEEHQCRAFVVRVPAFGLKHMQLQRNVANGLVDDLRGRPEFVFHRAPRLHRRQNTDRKGHEQDSHCMPWSAVSCRPHRTSPPIPARRGARCP